MPIRKVNGKSFSCSATVVRIKIQNPTSIFPVFEIVMIVPKYSLCQPLQHESSALCVFVLVLYWYRYGSAHVFLDLNKKIKKKNVKSNIGINSDF